RSTFVFLHPSGVPDPHRQADFWLPQLVGYPMETALAVARLVFGRVLERHPLTLCLAHGGGCLPALRGRLDLGWERKEVARTTAVRPSEFTDRLYYDTRCSPRRCCAGWSRTSGSTTCCWGPTTRSSSGTGRRSTRSRPGARPGRD